MWRQLMVSLGLWPAPSAVAVHVPPPVAIRCPLGGTDIRRVFRLHRAQLARCYTRVVEYRGGPEGTAVLHVTIAPDGRVIEVSVDGDLDDERVTRCLAAEVARWRFGASDTIIAVRYPLRMRLAR